MAIAEEPENISKEEYKRRKQKIKAELERLNANLSVFTKGEIKELPSLISEEEKSWELQMPSLLIPWMQAYWWQQPKEYFLYQNLCLEPQN
jgi:hypothetical protein